jgi:hypothetical protein
VIPLTTLDVWYGVLCASTLSTHHPETEPFGCRAVVVGQRLGICIQQDAERSASA